MKDLNDNKVPSQSTETAKDNNLESSPIENIENKRKDTSQANDNNNTKLSVVHEEEAETSNFPSKGQSFWVACEENPQVQKSEAKLPPKQVDTNTDKVGIYDDKDKETQPAIKSLAHSPKIIKEGTFVVGLLPKNVPEGNI